MTTKGASMAITGRDIRADRQAANITQTELAKACGISIHRLIDIERERTLPVTPSADEIMAVVARLENQRQAAGQ